MAKIDRLVINKEIVAEAVARGYSTRQDIIKATGLNYVQIKEIFEEYPDIFAKFKVSRSELVNVAADNMDNIVRDRSHPKNYDASKWVLNNYKSDLDESLIRRSNDIEMEITPSNDSSKPVQIRFSRPIDK